MTEQQKWSIDPNAESKFRQLGLTVFSKGDRVKTKSQCKSPRVIYTQNVHIAEIDVEGSRDNNARLLDPYNEDLAFDYAVAMEGGDEFPAIVIAKDSESGLYRVKSGNHRLGAAIQNDQTVLDAYVSEADEEINELITRTANRWMGDRQSKAETVMHARVMMDKYGRNAQELAPFFGVKYEWLIQQLMAENVREELLSLDVDASRFPVQTLQKLNVLRHNAKLQSTMGHLVADNKLPFSRVAPIVDDIMTAKSETAGMRVLRKYKDEIEGEKSSAGRRRAPIKQPHRSRFLRKLHDFATYLERGRQKKSFDTLKQLQITEEEDVQQILSEWHKLRSRIDELFASHARVAHAKTTRKSRQKTLARKRSSRR